MPNWRWISTIPDYYNLWCAIRGSGSMEVDGTAYPIKAGTAFVLAPGQRISALHDRNDPIHNFTAHFHTLGKGGKRISAAEFPLAAVAVRDAALFESVTRQVIRLAAAGDALGAQLAAQWVCALAGQIAREARMPALDPVDQRILGIAERISSNPGRRATVANMAREAGLSRVHFTRRFVRATGQTPSQYLIRRRIERASHLIQQSPLKMSEIAEILGYSDVFFFSRQFKRATGFAPSLLRRPAPKRGS